jgi:hypothetical protein
MKIAVINNWSSEFFEKYRLFRNKIHEGLENDFPLEIGEYEKFFSDESPFHTDFSWEAFVVSEENETLAQGILSWRKNSNTGNLGFLDLSQNSEAANMLFESISKRAKEFQLEFIKSPVDLNFFIKYRMKIKGEGEAFYGEPLYPDYYQKLFQENEFEIIGTWDTYQVSVWSAVRDFFKKRERVDSLKQSGKVQVRSVRLKEWENELKIIYDLFLKSYSEMPEFEPISFGQFKFVYDDFKYIIQPWLSYIVEFNNLPVGFCINYVDPLPVLKKVRNKKLSQIDKAILFFKLRCNFKTLLISYVGKIPGPNGEEVKGVQIKVSKKLTPFSLLMNKVLVTYQNTDSPSRKSWNPSVLNPYSQYVLYGKKLK